MLTPLRICLAVSRYECDAVFVCVEGVKSCQTLGLIDRTRLYNILYHSRAIYSILSVYVYIYIYMYVYIYIYSTVAILPMISGYKIIFFGGGGRRAHKGVTISPRMVAEQQQPETC